MPARRRRPYSFYMGENIENAGTIWELSKVIERGNSPRTNWCPTAQDSDRK